VPLTPRTAAVLGHSLSLLADEVYDQIYRSGRPGGWVAGPLGAVLPCFAGQDEWFLRRYARAFDDLNADLEVGRHPTPTCTAEDVALDLAIQDAERIHHDEAELVTDLESELPGSRYDYDWGTARGRGPVPCARRPSSPGWCCWADRRTSGTIGGMTIDEEQRRRFRRKASREMLEADVYAGTLVDMFRSTRHEAEAGKLAQRVADSAVDALLFQRGAHRNERAAERAEEARHAAKIERQQAEEAVERWFAEDKAQKPTR